MNAPFGDVLRDLLRDALGQQHQPERLWQARFQIQAVIYTGLFPVRAEDRLTGESALRG